jgi:hypothetical protein
MNLDLDTQRDVTRLLDDFLIFGKSGSIGSPGWVVHSAVETLKTDDERVGKYIYILIGNTPLTTASDPTTATSWFIYKSESIFEAGKYFNTHIALGDSKFERMLVGKFGAPVDVPYVGKQFDTLQLSFETRSGRLTLTTTILIGLTTLTLLSVILLRRKN